MKKSFESRVVLMYLFDDIHSLDDGSKDDVLAVQPRGLGGAHKELGAVGVRSGVGHAQDS